ncbi:MAG: YchJ family protein [Pedobacter sp.]|nr:MAG: YchJ family protein [Pedobacter sp.]
MADLCPCNSDLVYHKCCEPYHQNKTIPAKPETLMRSRYCAYALHKVDYLIETTHLSIRHLHQKTAIKAWAEANVWLRLEICFAKEDIVEFKAYYQHKGKIQVHHERSIFKKEGERWYYLSGSYFD